MPELPEVEHTRLKLTRWMQGATLAHVTTADARLVRPSTPKAFVKALTGAKVTAIERKGKWLKLVLGDASLFVHLGMTGWFVKEEAPKFARVTFDLVKNGKRSRVVYTDSRRWGRFVVTEDSLPTWDALGPDPLADGIDLGALAAKLARRKKAPVKVALMDQTVLAGVGNIQAIEALWKAKIDPRSLAAALTREDLRAVAAGLRWTIERTLADLAVNEEGTDNPFRIYGRKGTPCRRCKTTLERIELGGRTTTFCPGCQEKRIPSVAKRSVA